MLDRDRPLGVDVEFSQVGDQHARVLAGDVAEDHVTRRLAGSALEIDEVADGRSVLEEVEYVLGLVGRDDDPHVDHRHKLPWGPAVLTDYHVHLRPDELDATAAEYFTEANVERYLDAARAAGDRGAGRLRAHPPLRRRARPSGTIRSGARTRWTISPPTATSSARPRCSSGSRWTTFPAARTGSPSLLDAHEFDYVVGSVHFLGDGAVDDPTSTSGAATATPTGSGGATSR